MPVVKGLVEKSRASLVFNLANLSDGEKTSLAGIGTVTLWWRIDGATVVTKVSGVDSLSVTDAATGEITYNPIEADFTPGNIVGGIEWLDGSSIRRSTEKFTGRIEPRY